MTNKAAPEAPVHSNLGTRLVQWLDPRTGIDSLLHESLDEPIPGGAKWAYIFGSGLLFLFVSQVITGVFLALYYVPSADHAHTVVSYIVKEVTSGSFSAAFMPTVQVASSSCFCFTSGKPFSMGLIRGAGNCCGSPAASFWP